MWAAWIAMALAAADGGYAGASACRACHTRQFEAQSASGHARALHRLAEHPLRERFQGEAAEWAFGSGRQGVTFVRRLDASTFLELALSYYTTPGRLDLSPGHTDKARGQRFRAQPPGFSIGRCFECHSTGAVSISKDAVAVTEHGVRCEACHGPARAHAANPGLKNAVRGRKKIDGDEMNVLCGGCHRAPGGDHANDFSNPWNVRHQPPYLEQSKCFQASGGQLTCVTCHDPHAGLAAVRELGSYDSRCSSCHKTAGPQCRANCVTCHMPQVRAGEHLKFRNHWIGVYRGPEPRLIPER